MSGKIYAVPPERILCILVEMESKIHVQPPVKYTGLKRSDPPTYAGGIKAIESSMRHVFSQTGVRAGIQLLSNVNQFNGFDCPGCAWPDPDEDRSFVEFCENGAKAVAEEGTREKADPDFFAKHSIQELSSWSDYELGKAGRITHPLKLEGNHYTPVEWEEAFKEIAEGLNALNSHDEATF